MPATTAIQPRDYRLTIPLVKSDRIKGLVTGWASISRDDNGDLVIDADGDVIPIEEMERAAHEALLVCGPIGAGGDMHERRGVADLVESFVVTADKRAALNLGTSKREGWIVTLLIRDKELLDQIIAGEKMEFSIAATARRIPLRTDAFKLGMQRLTRIMKRRVTSASSCH